MMIKTLITVEREQGAHVAGGTLSVNYKTNTVLPKNSPASSPVNLQIQE